MEKTHAEEDLSDGAGMETSVRKFWLKLQWKVMCLCH